MKISGQPPPSSTSAAPAGARLKALEEENERLRSLCARAGHLAEIGQLAVRQNHELRQPLLAIRGLAQLLLEKNSFAVHEVHESARHIVEQSDRMVDLVAAIRRGAAPRPRPSSSSAVLSSEKVANVAAVLARVRSLLDYRLRAGITLTIDVESDEGPPLAAADGTEIEQIVINLLCNALDAVAGVAAPVIQVRARRVLQADRPVIEVCVADDGAGIGSDIRPHLFEPFFTTKGEESGTGLGLAISRELARGCGGDLALLDRPGAWPRPTATVFRLTLPAA